MVVVGGGGLRGAREMVSAARGEGNRVKVARCGRCGPSAGRRRRAAAGRRQAGRQAGRQGGREAGRDWGKREREGRGDG